MEHYSPKEFIPVDASIHSIDASNSWSHLEDNEKKYAYYMARAAWEGSKICWFQRSYESPALLVLLKLVFAHGVQSLKEQSGVSDTEWKQFTVYSASVFQNCGNFKSFGDTKFVPELPPTRFEHIIFSAKAYLEHKPVFDHIWEVI